MEGEALQESTSPPAEKRRAERHMRGKIPHTPTRKAGAWPDIYEGR